MTTAHATLLEMLAHHYGLVTRCCARLDVEQARAGTPSIAWILGHLTHVADTTLEAVGGTARSLPEGFARHALPSWGVADTAGWDALRAAWRATSEAARTAVAALEPGDLERPPAAAIRPEFAHTLTSRRRFLQGHVFHVAYHLGQIGLRRAELGLGWEDL